MLHKISDFCKKIDSIKAQADKLYNLKYNQPKTPERDAEVVATRNPMIFRAFRGLDK